MRKRAALIRTLAYDPPVILMDEPFAAVDAQTRAQLQADLLRLWNLKRKTIIFVTHDITEAIALGDRAGAQPAAGEDRRRAHDPDPAPAQGRGYFRGRGFRHGVRTHPRGHPMTQADLTVPILSEAPAVSRKWLVLGGRVVLAVLLVLGGAGRAHVRRGLRVAARCGHADRQAGGERQLFADVASTLRVSALGFAIACVAGVLLPFLLRRSPRLSEAVEPYIMASMGSQIRARALAHPLVRHWRHAQARGRDADGVLHHLHHDHGRHSRRRSAPGQHGAHRRRRRGGIAREIIWKSLCRFSSG